MGTHSAIVADSVRPAVAEVVLRRMGARAALSPEEQDLLRSVVSRIEVHAAGAEIYGEGAARHHPRIILSGWACRMRMLGDGRRQIFGFVLPGDAVGICRRPRPLSLTTTLALTRVETCNGGPLLAHIESGDGGGGLLRAATLAAAFDEAYLLDQVVRLGRQTAYERMAHLLLELGDRMAEVGLGDGRRFPVPLTQEILADALGLSVVHVNRTLQQMRRRQLIEMRTGMVSLLDPETLKIASDYRRPQPSAW